MVGPLTGGGADRTFRVRRLLSHDDPLPPRMTPHLLLRGGTLLRPESQTTRSADLLIRDGTIAAIGDNLDTEGDVPVASYAGTRSEERRVGKECRL